MIPERDEWLVYMTGGIYIGHFEMDFQEMAESGFVKLTKPRQILQDPRGNKLISDIIGLPEEITLNMNLVQGVWRVREEPLIKVYWESISGIKVVPAGSVPKTRG